MGSSSKGKKSGGYRTAGGNRKRCGSVRSRSSEETTTTVKSPDQINTNPIFKGHVEPQPLTEDIAFGTENRWIHYVPFLFTYIVLNTYVLDEVASGPPRHFVNKFHNVVIDFCPGDGMLTFSFEKHLKHIKKTGRFVPVS